MKAKNIPKEMITVLACGIWIGLIWNLVKLVLSYFGVFI